MPPLAAVEPEGQRYYTQARQALDVIAEAEADARGLQRPHGYLPSWMVAEQLRSGQLQAVLADHAGPPAPINAVYPTQTMVPRRATVFIDFIAALCAATPGLNGVAIV